jgi:hypothetical protein
MKKDPPLRGQARRDAQTAAGKTPAPQPSKQQDQGIPTRPENLAIYNTMTPEQQARYRKIRANKGGPEALKYLQQFQGQAAATGPTPESVTEQGFMGAGEAYGDVLQRFQGFDPYQMQQQYEPGFQQEMDRARQNVLGQFERRNQRQFEQQRTSLQQQIAERGLDPASPAAQELMRQQNEREDMARQEAMSAAEQAAYSVQQQGFGQAGQLAMMPYEQWQAIQQPYIAGIGAQYGQQQLSAQQQFEAQQQKQQLASAERIARMSRGGGGGGSQGPSLYERMEAEALGRGYNQQPQQNPWANVAQGVATGATQGITNWALK